MSTSPFDPSVLFDAVARDGDASRARLQPAAVARLCEGHFPGAPLVPGAYALGIFSALLDAHRAAGAVPRVRIDRVDRAVFRAPIVPSSAVVAHVSEVGPRSARAAIEPEAGGRPLASALLSFTELP